MGVGLARVGVLGNGDGRDSLGDGHVLSFRFFNELREPGFEVQAVVEHQVSGVRLLQVGGGGLVLVNLCAGLGEGFDVQVVACHVASDVCEHGEGGEHSLLTVAALSAFGGAGSATATGEYE